MEETSVVTRPPDKTSARAITAFILGILSLVLCCFPPVNLILGVIALVLGILEWKAVRVGKVSETGKGLALAGAILGGLGVFLSLVMIFVGTMFWVMNRNEILRTFFDEMGRVGVRLVRPGGGL